MFLEICALLNSTICLCCMIYGGYRFLVCDKRGRETLWYGILLIAALL